MKTLIDALNTGARLNAYMGVEGRTRVVIVALGHVRREFPAREFDLDRDMQLLADEYFATWMPEPTSRSLLPAKF